MLIIGHLLLAGMLAAAVAMGSLEHSGFGSKQCIAKDEQVAGNNNPIGLVVSDSIRQFPENERDDCSSHNGHDEQRGPR